ncbi:MAG: LysR family transcriptional regulator [Burkholderiaceae bacterium]
MAPPKRPAAKPAKSKTQRSPRSAELSWNLIQSFLAVLDTGSLLAASRQLRTTQPTVGRHIEALEGQLAVLLFDRTARGLVPTTHAHRIAADARQMQSGADQIARIAAGQGEQEQLSVRVSASDMVALHVLPAAAIRLATLAPNIKLAIVASDEVVNLLKRDADIAIRMVRPSQSSLIARRIGEVRLLPCAAQSHIDRWGMPDSTQALMRQPFVLPDRDHGFSQFLASSGLSVESFNVALRTDSFPLNWEAVSAGLGAGVASEYMIKRNPHVHALPIDLPVPPLPVWLAVHRELKTNPRIRQVFDFLADELLSITSEAH